MLYNALSAFVHDAFRLVNRQTKFFRKRVEQDSVKQPPFQNRTVTLTEYPLVDNGLNLASWAIIPLDILPQGQPPPSRSFGRNQPLF